MSKTVVMTLRLPPKVAHSVERLASRFGHKPAQLGARLLEEALRRRDHPLIDLRETAAGRVAYVAGTRFAVYWLAQMIDGGRTLDQIANLYELPIATVRAALAYAQAFPDEIEADIADAEANRDWLEQQDIAWRPNKKTASRVKSRARTNASR